MGVMGATAITARDVADYFLAHVDEESGDNISNLKLQKLLYYAQGFHLALFGEPLFDDAIVAWQHGPVVADLYHTFKEFGAGAIPPPESFDTAKYSPKITELLDEVLEVYGQFSALRLRSMTHDEAPWSQTSMKCSIPHDLMRDYFKTLVVNGKE